VLGNLQWLSPVKPFTGGAEEMSGKILINQAIAVPTDLGQAAKVSIINLCIFNKSTDFNIFTF